jgi:TPP-dependent indolepyruvate ferredoxin oxidoreductase alpha subunit
MFLFAERAKHPMSQIARVNQRILEHSLSGCENCYRSFSCGSLELAILKREKRQKNPKLIARMKIAD